MRFFANRTLRRQAAAFLLPGLVLAAAGFFLSPLCGALLLLSGLLSCLLYVFFSVRQLRALSALSQSVDRVLHGQDAVLISGSEEGELSELASEIGKMTVRLREQTERLSADKLRLTDAIADIFHQIRTPMTSMNLLLSLLSEETLSYERRISYLHELKKQLARTDWLVESLLKISKIDAGAAQFARVSVRLSDLIRQACEPFAVQLELRGITLVTNVREERLSGDPQWTAEALGNIVKNCMEHTPEGGRIEISAEENAIYTGLVVRDTGSGFDPADLPHLFDRFYRGSGASPAGIGIGLALARMIVTAQNGTLRAQNAPEGGAQFTLRFYKTVV